MAINATDIAILKSERFTDEADGGGAMTGTAIPNGVVNNLWDDISRDLLAYGGVSLRKMFCAVRSANTDKALGGHVILLQDSAADNVSTILCATDDHYDERADAQQAIEQYVVLGNRSALRPVGTQRQGQTSIVLYADRDADAPEIGEVLIMKSAAHESPVKVSRVDVQETEYTYIDRSGNYQRYPAYQMTLKITQELSADFPGDDPSPVAQHGTEIFKTQSNSSANYYGTRPVKVSALAGSRSVTVDSIFSPLVPAATTEQPILDQNPGLLATVIQQTGPLRQLSLGNQSGVAQLTLPQCWVPGSLRVLIAGSEYRDEGNTLTLVEGINRLTDAATIVSARKTLTLPMVANAAVEVHYLPGVALQLMPYTAAFEITAGNRQLTYTEQLAPTPMPGSVRVEFQYLGKWYALTDNASGSLSGPAGANGTVNYATGSVAFTLPGEPDQGSQIIVTWARSPYFQLGPAPLDAALEIKLGHVAEPGSVQLSWAKNSTNHTANADGNDELTGAATGVVLGDRVLMRSTNLPTGDITVNFNRLDTTPTEHSVSIAERTGGNLVFNCGQVNVQPQSVKFTLAASVAITTNVGGIIKTSRVRRNIACVGNARSQLVSAGVVVGSIDAATGDVTVDCNLFTADVNDFIVTSEVLLLGTIQRVTKTLRIEGQSLAVFSIGSANVVATSVTQSIADTMITATLDKSQPLVAGAQALSVGGVDLYDTGNGQLYHDFDYQTGIGIQSGAIDYSGANIEVAYSAVAGQISDLNSAINCAAGGVGAAAAVTSVVFRTAASPLRPSGLQFLARRAQDTALMRAESANDGTITGSFDPGDVVGELPQPGSINGYALPIIPEGTAAGSATGTVDYETGVVAIEFSEPVILSTLTYNAVSYTTVPLSSDILGLNPVRLPTNGYVPVFKSGYLAVIHNTETLEVASPAAGQVIDCGRTDLAVVTIRDASGADLDGAQYALDKAAGTITLADPLLLQDSESNSLTLPLTVSHRVEDTVALGGVEVGGQLQLLTEINHDYPAHSSYVSSAVHFGVLQSRITDIRDYKIDSGDFVGAGDPANGTYDSINNPILISNRSTVNDRWKLRFTSTTSYECSSERRGVIGTGNVGTDFSPINPYTNEPYFTVKAAGWGSGWVSSNVVLFSTVAAASPFWAIRTTLPSNLPAPQDSTVFEFRAEAD